MGLRRFGIEPSEYLKMFLKFGFKLYEINESKKKIEPTTAEKLLSLYTPERGNQTNLLCIRK